MLSINLFMPGCRPQTKLKLPASLQADDEFGSLNTTDAKAAITLTAAAIRATARASDWAALSLEENIILLNQLVNVNLGEVQHWAEPQSACRAAAGLRSHDK